MANARIRPRGDTAANWSFVNPVLESREIAVETDTFRVKIGDGVTAWASLPYISPGSPGDVGKAVSRAVLAAITGQVTGQTMILVETGREGIFIFDSTNISAHVSGGYAYGDTQQAIYVLPASDTTGASGAWVRKFNGSVKAEWFGAKLDGATDDTAAWQAALANAPSGSTIKFRGFSLISGTLVWQKPVNIDGGPREQSGFLVSASGTYKQTPDGVGNALWLPHSTTVVPGETAGIDARHSELRGFTVKPATTAPANVRGILFTVVASARNVSVDNMASDGWAILASANPSTDTPANLPFGNANIFSLKDCRAYQNGGKGLYIAGNNANAGDFGNFDADQNTGKGIDDQSFLGNNGNPQLDSNAGGNMSTSSLSSSKTTLVGAYFEQQPAANSFGPGTMVLNAKGSFKANATLGGLQFQTIPTGAVMTRDLVFADTDDIANSRGDSPTAGAMLALSKTGIDFKAIGTGQHLKLNQNVSPNYIDFENNGNVNIRFAVGPITGNLDSTRPWLPGGFVTGANVRSGIVGAGSAAPTTGSYDIGAIYLNDTPAAAGKVGWVCVTAGSPGTWKAFGAIDA